MLEARASGNKNTCPLWVPSAHSAYFAVREEDEVTFPRRSRREVVSILPALLAQEMVALRVLRTTPCPPWNGVPYFPKDRIGGFS